jgi:hypothetical protein
VGKGLEIWWRRVWKFEGEGLEISGGRLWRVVGEGLEISGGRLWRVVGEGPEICRWEGSGDLWRWPRILWRRIWRLVGEALESCGEKSEELNGGVWTTEERRITSLEEGPEEL